MNNQPTYEQQWQKITSAYLNNELNPYHPCACFIGNLLNKKPNWAYARIFGISEGLSYTINKIKKREAISFISQECNSLYTLKDLYDMENVFLKILLYGNKVASDCEDTLFLAMTTTLEMLRQIHISKGENVDAITLQKRELCGI